MKTTTKGAHKNGLGCKQIPAKSKGYILDSVVVIDLQVALSHLKASNKKSRLCGEKGA